jgi:hypothetical protein
MKLERVGPTPQFWKFGTDYYLLTDELLEKGPPVYLQRRKPLKIPSYQRNIVWRGKEITDLLDSKSELFGGVILVERTEILKLRDHPFELVDGLQRFATATALLNELYPLVLSADPSRPDISDCFANLRMDVQNSQPIFSHNDTALRSHRRSALKKSYLELCCEVRKIILDNISDRQKASIFAPKIEGMFLEKQIAIDEYHGFSGETDLTNTFITMNSKGTSV